MTIPSCAVKKFTKRLNHSAANIHIFQFVAQGLFLHSTRNSNSLGPIYSSIMTNQTTSGLERQIGPFSGPYLDIGPDWDQVPKSGPFPVALIIFTKKAQNLSCKFLLVFIIKKAKIEKYR